MEGKSNKYFKYFESLQLVDIFLWCDLLIDTSVPKPTIRINNDLGKQNKKKYIGRRRFSLLFKIFIKQIMTLFKQ